jgi:putative ABC transport system permease protein
VSLWFTLRQLRRSPAYITAVVLSLAIGMALCGVVFSVLGGLLFAAVPGIANRNTVIHIRWTGGHDLLTQAEFETVERELAPVLGEIAAQGERRLPVVLPSGAATTTVAFVSARLFETLGTVAIRGRLFNRTDIVFGAPPVAVISEAFWRRNYGGDPDAVGRPLTIADRPFVIIGISPAAFPGLRLIDQGIAAENTPQVWVPLTSVAREAGWLAVGGRLLQPADLAALQARLAVTAARVAQESPTGDQRRSLRWFRAGLNWTDNPSESLLTVGLVLMVPLSILAIGCANVINLQLARATERTRELSVRLTLGASPMQLLRLLAVEVVILTCIAGGVGWLGARLLLIGVQPLFARPLALDGTVLWLLLILVALVIAVAGSVPAWLALRRVIALGIKQGPDSVPHKKIRAALVVVQVAVSVVLLFISGAGIRTLQAQHDKLPVHAEDILTAEFDLREMRQPSQPSAVFIESILARLRDHGQIGAASFATFLRFGQPVQFWRLHDDDSVRRTAYAGAVTPEWFDVMGIRLLAGRRFSDSGSFTDVVVNETLASQLGGGAVAVGTRLRLKGHDGGLETREVVGVVEDQLMSPIPMALLPMPATPPPALVLLVRASDVAAAFPAVRKAIQATEPLAPLDTIKPLAARVDEGFSGMRSLVILGATLGTLAVLLAAVGEYAVLAFSVRRRTREIGIRMAVGATRKAVVALVLNQGLSVTLVGLVLGFSVAVPVRIIMRSAFLGLSPVDPFAMVPVAAGLLLVSLAASLLPALRAMRVDPSVALRDE